MWKLLWISWQWYTPNSGQWLSLERREGGEIWIGHTESINWVCQVLFLKLGDDWGVCLLLFTSSGFLKHFMIFKIFPGINMPPPSEQSKGLLIIGVHCLLLTWELISQMRQWRQLTRFHSGRMWICPKSATWALFNNTQKLTSVDSMPLPSVLGAGGEGALIFKEGDRFGFQF